MNIICPSCASEYEVPDGSIPASGRKVRCASCATVFMAFGDTGPLAEPEPDVSAEQSPAIEAETETYESNPFDTAAQWSPEPEPAAPPVEIAVRDSRDVDNSVELDAWIAIASENQIRGAKAENDQDSIDSLFGDEPAEPSPGDEAAAAVEAGEAPAGEPALVAARPRRGLVNGHIGKFKPKAGRSGALAAASVALALALVMSLIAFRGTIVSLVPPLGSVYAALGMGINLRGLEIVNIASEISQADGIEVLVVKGEIVNPGHDARALPALFFGLLDEQGKQHYAWSVKLDEATIEAGATLPFRRRLATPPAEARKVLVRFFSEGDPAPTGTAPPDAAKTNLP